MRFITKAFIFSLLVLILFGGILPSLQASNKLQIVKLAKTATGYAILWYEEDSNTFKVEEFFTLKKAKNFLNTFSTHSDIIPYAYISNIKYATIQKQNSNYILNWEFLFSARKFRLTFPSLEDARYFKEKIELGAYAKSSYGHSIKMHRL